MPGSLEGILRSRSLMGDVRVCLDSICFFLELKVWILVSLHMEAWVTQRSKCSWRNMTVMEWPKKIQGPLLRACCPGRGGHKMWVSLLKCHLPLPRYTELPSPVFLDLKHWLYNPGSSLFWVSETGGPMLIPYNQGCDACWDSRVVSKLLWSWAGFKSAFSTDWVLSEEVVWIQCLSSLSQI